jgi:hypothetical protein
MNGSDIPRYPDIDYDAGTSTQTTYSAPPGWPADVSTFKNDAFWVTVSSKAPTDETNTLTFKHYVAFNQFELLPGSSNARVLRDDGTHPVEEVEPFGPARILPTHLNWSERSVTFLANNRYTGFSGIPRFAMMDYESVAEVETTATQGAPKWRTNLSAPGNGREVPSNFLQLGGVPNVFGQTGGELVGTGTFTPVALPTWFRVARLQ